MDRTEQPEARHQRKARDSTADMMRHLVDDVREGLLDQGPRKEGLLATPEATAMFHSLAEVAVQVLASRIRLVQSICVVSEKEADRTLTTEQIMESRVVPEVSAAMAGLLVKEGHAQIGMDFPSHEPGEAASVEFRATLFTLRQGPVRSQQTSKTGLISGKLELHR